MKLIINFLSSAVVLLFFLFLQGCNPESGSSSDPDVAIRKIPVSLPENIDIDLYRIEITTDSTEPIIYYEKPGSNGLFISVPAGCQSQLLIEGYRNELLVFSSNSVISAGQKDAARLNPNDPTPIFPPSQISATLTDANTVQLSWTECSGAVSYIIYRTKDTLVDPEKLQTVTEVSFTDKSSGSTGSYYQVKAQFLNGISVPTRLVSVTSEDIDTPTVSDTPEPPLSINNGILHDSTIYISWSSSIGATGYNVYRSETESGSYTLAGTVTDTIFTVALNFGRAYYFKISTKGREKESVPSTPIKIQITKPSLPVPKGLTAVVQPSGSILLSFEASSGASRYIIYRGTSPTDMASIDTTVTSSYTDTTLDNSTTCYYKVVAIGTNQRSEPSDVVSVTVKKPLLSTPSGLIATSSSATSINVQFNPSSNATGYIIYRGFSAASLSRITTTNATSYEDKNLSQNTTYYYAVAAINGSDTSAISSSVSSKTGALVPSAPTGLAATTVSSSSIRIQFQPVEAATGYIVYRGTSSGSLPAIDTITATSLTDQGLQSTTTYYYAVAAYNADGVSTQSATVSAATQDSPPATPSGLKVSATTVNSITVQFNSVTGATGYKVYSSTNNNTFTLLASITTTTYTNTGLAAATTRYYKVSSIKGSVESPQSSSVSGTTQNVAKKIAVVNASRCTGCRLCLPCTPGALTIVNRKAIIDPSKCDGCGKCVSRCPKGALSLQ